MDEEIERLAGISRDQTLKVDEVNLFEHLGGPPRYSERKGHPALIARHVNFNMSKKAAERWILHMRAAFEDTPGIDADSRERMLNFFTHTAYFLHLGVTGRGRRQISFVVVIKKEIFIR